jgi:hypothetical protein
MRMRVCNFRFQSQRKRVASLEAQRNQAADRAAELEVEHDACATALDALRHILACKRSPDVIRKLFYDRPLNASNARRLPGNCANQGGLFVG